MKPKEPLSFAGTELKGLKKQRLFLTVLVIALTIVDAGILTYLILLSDDGFRPESLAVVFLISAVPILLAKSAISEIAKKGFRINIKKAYLLVFFILIFVLQLAFIPGLYQKIADETSPKYNNPKPFSGQIIKDIEPPKIPMTVVYFMILCSDALCFFTGYKFLKLRSLNAEINLKSGRLSCENILNHLMARKSRLEYALEQLPAEKENEYNLYTGSSGEFKTKKKLLQIFQLNSLWFLPVLLVLILLLFSCTGSDQKYPATGKTIIFMIDRPDTLDTAEIRKVSIAVLERLKSGDKLVVLPGGETPESVEIWIQYQADFGEKNDRDANQIKMSILDSIMKIVDSERFSKEKGTSKIFESFAVASDLVQGSGKSPLIIYYTDGLEHSPGCDFYQPDVLNQGLKRLMETPTDLAGAEVYMIGIDVRTTGHYSFDRLRNLYEQFISYHNGKLNGFGKNSSFVFK
jgi:hypothetical protein